jgi:hypothetical protein
VRASRLVIAMVAALVGLVWLGQGLGYIPGSFMTGSQFWATVGTVLLVVAIALMVVEVRRSRAGERR